jgi:replication fork protection complex subunit Tof1/Swi1
MIRGENCLDHDLSCFRDWEELTRQIFKRLIKRLPEHPELMVEMLFSKIPATMFYLEHGYEKEVTKSAPRPPAELTVSPLIAEGDRIGVVTEAMVSAAQFDMIKWVKDELTRASEERRAWADAEAARKAAARESLASAIEGQVSEEQLMEKETEDGEESRAPPISKSYFNIIGIRSLTIPSSSTFNQ